MFVAACWSYGEKCRSIVRSTVTLANHSEVEFSILALPYKSTSNFIEIFHRLKTSTCTSKFTPYMI